MDIRQTLRYLRAPIGSKSFLFGDNRSVVTSATLPHSTLTKHHNILAFHRGREAIATQEKEKENLKMQPEQLKEKENKNKNQERE